jgi:trigger factor
METQIKLENVSAIQKKFLVTIPAAKITKAVEKKFLEVQKTANIKGFRPGKVPINLVKQYYGEDVKSKALNSLINETYSEAIKKHPLRIVGEPQIEGVAHEGHAADDKGHTHLHIHDGQDLTYSAMVEVVPEIEPKDYKGLSLEKPSAEVTSKDLEGVKTNLLSRKAEITPTDRAAAMGDFVDFKYDGKVKDGETPPELSGDRYAEIGSGQLIPDFEKNLIGMKNADDYTDKNLAGKEASYEVSMREVKEKKLPELSDDLLKEFGYESVQDFETKSKEALIKTKAEESDNQLRNNMIEKLIEKNTFEVPQALVYSQMRALADDYTEELKRYGFNEQMIQSAVMSQLADFKKRAEMQVRAGILLDAIAKKEKIESTPADIEKEMKKTAGNFGVDIKVLKDRFDQSPRDKANFEYRVKEELTIQMILAAAKIK